jgi:hypothetical protein
MLTAAALLLRCAFCIMDMLGSAVLLVGLHLVSLDAKELLETTQKKMRRKLNQARNKEWMENLETLVRLINEKVTRPSMRLVYKDVICNEIIKPLIQVEAAIERHPEINDVSINRPIFISGSGRNGSTLLQALMANYPELRYLTLPECREMLPTDEEREFDPDWRQERDERWKWKLDLSQKALVDFRIFSHELTPNKPEECIPILSRYMFIWPIYTLGAMWKGQHVLQWLKSKAAYVQDAYNKYKQELQLMLFYDRSCHGSDRPTRLLLKCPIHSAFHNVIRQVFPGAFIIRLHRDPVKMAGSHCSMHSGISEAFGVQQSNKYIGKRTLEWLSLSCQEMVKEETDQQVIDIKYQDLMADPIKVCGQIAQVVGLEHTEDVVQKLQNHIAANPKHKHGVHKYSATDYGIDSQAIRSDFREYCQTFGV